MKYPAYPNYQEVSEKWIGRLPANWHAERMKFCFSEKKSTKNASLPAGAISFGKAVIKGDEKVNPETRETYQEVLSGEFIVNPINLNYDLISLRTALSKVDICVSPAYIVLKENSNKIFKPYGEFLLHVFDVSHMKSLGAGVRQTINFNDIGQCIVPLPPMEEQKSISSFLEGETTRIDALIAKKTRFIELLKEKRQAVITKAVTKGLDCSVQMKDSEVEWLGEVPAHWEVTPFKWHIDKNDGGVWGDDPTGDDDTIVLRSTEQTVDGEWSIKDPAARKLSSSEKAAALLRAGDLLVTKSSGSALHIGKTTLVTEEIAKMECCYSNFMQRLRTRYSFSPKLAWYLMNSPVARLQFDLLSNSTTGLANLNGSMLGQILVAVPSTSEQDAIIAFLDRQTSKIDAIVAKTERSIELLKERRSALITAAVTGKIDVREVA